MSNLTSKGNQLQGNQDQKAQTVFMTSCGRDTKLSENRVAKVTGSLGNNGAEPKLTSVEEKIQKWCSHPKHSGGEQLSDKNK